MSRWFLASADGVLLVLIQSWLPEDLKQALRVLINGRFPRSSFLNKKTDIVFRILIQNFLADFYLFKVNKKDTRKTCKICSKLTMKTPERRHLHRSGVFIVNFEHISHLFLVFLLFISCWIKPLTTFIFCFNSVANV